MATSSTSFRLLVLNPNSSEEMSEGVKKVISEMLRSDKNSDYEFTYYTAPHKSPLSINNGDDLALSTEVVLADLAIDNKLEGYDGVLVACFSVHPLVKHLASQYRGSKMVLGIFEAGILSALTFTSLYPAEDTHGRAWGVVTTGKFWEGHLEAGVKTFLGQDASSSNHKFAGVWSTGLDAGDFHGKVPQEIVRAKLKEATKKLLAFGRVGCVVMGCAGMAGLEEIIRSAIDEEHAGGDGSEEVVGFGEQQNKVYIIDGVKAGAGLLLETVRNERRFSGDLS